MKLIKLLALLLSFACFMGTFFSAFSDNSSKKVPYLNLTEKDAATLNAILSANDVKSYIVNNYSDLVKSFYPKYYHKYSQDNFKLQDKIPALKNDITTTAAMLMKYKGYFTHSMNVYYSGYKYQKGFKVSQNDLSWFSLGNYDFNIKNAPSGDTFITFGKDDRKIYEEKNNRWGQEKFCVTVFFWVNMTQQIKNDTVKAQFVDASYSSALCKK